MTYQNLGFGMLLAVAVSILLLQLTVFAQSVDCDFCSCVNIGCKAECEKCGGGDSNSENTCLAFCDEQFNDCIESGTSEEQCLADRQECAQDCA